MSGVWRGRGVIVAVVALVVATSGMSWTWSSDAFATRAGTAREERSSSSIGVGILDPVAIAPPLVQETEGAQISRLVFEKLTAIDENLRVVPAAASSWELSTDGRVYTFHLRPDGSFSNGDPVTAADFVLGFARAADPDLAAPLAGEGKEIVGWDDTLAAGADGHTGNTVPSGVRAVDDLTLEVATNEPFVFLPEILAADLFAPVPHKLFANGEPDGFADLPIGNGPYALLEPWDHGHGVSLGRNPHWQGSPSGATTIEFRTFANLRTAYREVLAGALDISAVPSPQVESARDTFGARFVSQPIGAVTYVGLPTQSEAFRSRSLRRALSRAIDRRAIAERLYGGKTQPGNDLVPPVSPASSRGGCPDCRYDLGGAKKLLRGTGTTERSVTLLYGDDGVSRGPAEAIANSWRQNLGIDVKLESHEFSDLVQLIYSPDAHDPYLLGWAWDYPSALSFVGPMLGTGGDGNTFGYSDPDVDALLAQAAAAPTVEAATSPLQQVQERAARAMPYIPVVFSAVNLVHSKRVGHVTVNEFGAYVLERVVPA
jgi:peptide/nickel transport system substrate-binding protein/oligopeptide transport system substrate-binding protein